MNIRRHFWYKFITFLSLCCTLVLYCKLLDKRSSCLFEETSSPITAKSVITASNDVKDIPLSLRILGHPEIKLVTETLLESYRCHDNVLCELNEYDPMGKSVFLRKTTREGAECRRPIDCVTIIIKSSGRFKELLALLRSIESFYDGISIAIMCEPVQEIPAYFSNYLNSKPNIIFRNLTSALMGISYGKNTLLNDAQTPFVFHVDDDMVLLNPLLEKLLKILQHTDTSLVGVRSFDEGYIYYGTMLYKSASNFNKSIIDFKEGYTYGSIPRYEDCIQSTLSYNIFLAYRLDLIAVGGWDQDQKFHEHQELFLKLTLAKRKIVYCPNERVAHHPVFDTYRSLRDKEVGKYRVRFRKKWNISHDML